MISIFDLLNKYPQVHPLVLKRCLDFATIKELNDVIVFLPEAPFTWKNDLRRFCLVTLNDKVTP